MNYEQMRNTDFTGYFEEIEDPRHPSYVEHKLSDVLTIVTCAVLSGLDTLDDIVTYEHEKASFFKESFLIEKLPSKATLARILAVVDGTKVCDVIITIMQKTFEVSDKVIAVDGKAIRSTIKGGSIHTALQILTAYVTSNGVILGQKAINKKTNEIPVFQEMLDKLNISGKTVTADAMHCQRDTCAKIISKGGDYLIGLKQNQKRLYDDVAFFFSDEINNDSLETHTTIEKNAGRIEKRVCRKITDISWLKDHNWPSVKSVFAIDRRIDVRGKISEERSYYISSLSDTPQVLMERAREHWKIESMHWLLDVTFSEDNSRFISQNAHMTLNAMRKLALAMHKKAMAQTTKKSSLKSSMLKCLIDNNSLSQLISIL